ncbi:hypothetical protein [Thiococcus pfennigii]|uniref:hypothetical protein n=1 Tax=Thiococcus pfennigii TaxID=1057 RepID=UPI001907FCD6|nr:hypothetical protein [Thiococcus pfennigii]
MRARNVLTYKSHQEPLDAWALDELIGHYVNDRKLLAAPASERLLPEPAFQLYAVATRTPRKLVDALPPGAVQPTAWPGVYDLQWGARTIRLIVLGEVAEHPRNAPWELFSLQLDRLRHGLTHYQARSALAGELLYRLYLAYRLELPNMSYTIEEFIRETHREVIAHLTPEERRAILEQTPPEERLRGLPPEERLRGLPPEERLRGLKLDELDANERATLEALLKKLN